MVTCEALTIRGVPCRSVAAHAVEVPGVGTQHLCGIHARRVRVRVRWAEVPPALAHPPNSGLPWTEEEDRYLLAHSNFPRHQLVERLGRSAEAVGVRLALLKREGRG